jgi:hypothetical protein
MEYEGSIGLATGKIIFFFAYFYFLFYFILGEELSLKRNIMLLHK